MTQIPHRLPGEGEAQPKNLHGLDSVGQYPAHGTGAARLLAYLLLGREVGPLDAWVQLGMYRLSDVKFRLRKADWPVDTEILQRSNRFGEPCAFASYYLPVACIKAAGEEGQEFARAEIALMDELLGKKKGH